MRSRRTRRPSVRAEPRPEFRQRLAANLRDPRGGQPEDSSNFLERELLVEIERQYRPLLCSQTTNRIGNERDSLFVSQTIVDARRAFIRDRARSGNLSLIPQRTRRDVE